MNVLNRQIPQAGFYKLEPNPDHSIKVRAIALIPDGTNQTGFMDLSVAGDKRQAGDPIDNFAEI